MALYATLKNGSEIKINVGDGAKIQALNFAGRDAVSVQADGHELEVIRTQFSGIRFHNTARVIEWFGDDAVFIAMHFKK